MKKYPWGRMPVSYTTDFVRRFRYLPGSIRTSLLQEVVMPQRTWVSVSGLFYAGRQNSCLLQELMLHALNAVRKHSWSETGMTNAGKFNFWAVPCQIVIFNIRGSVMFKTGEEVRAACRKKIRLQQ
jgi:hypothetical protein